MEQVARIELVSSPWEGEIITIIRYLQYLVFYVCDFIIKNVYFQWFFLDCIIKTRKTRVDGF